MASGTHTSGDQHGHGDHHGHGETGEHKHHGVAFYATIAVVLGLITAVELAPLFEIFYLPTGALLALSVVKFFLVVAFFMHLWDDPPIFTQMFVAPLIGGMLMVGVLMVLFQTFRPAPFEDSLAVVERYGDTYARTCSSWLRSHKSQRLYCASPPLDKDRVAYLGVQHIDRNGDGLLDRIELPVVGTGPEDDPAVIAAYKALGDDEARKAYLIEQGKGLYQQNCQACHQENGQGVVGVFPPLAQSDYLGTPEFHTKIVLGGLNGKIVVNGVEYNGAMQAFGPLLTDFQVAAIVSYERNAWNNNEGWISPEAVLASR
jgi:mono/diheme cytochrome c family protein/cytochrome c oxidase subunit IV